METACNFVDKTRKSKSARIIWIDEESFEKALDLFRKSEGKSRSFTEATSFVRMQELHIPSAFTFDGNFREAGFQMLP